MTDPSGILAFVVAFVTEPTFSIPLLLAAWTLVAWIAWSPSGGGAIPPKFRATREEPAGEMVSAMYHAVVDGSYSRVLGVAAEELDRVTVRTYGRSAFHLPWRWYPLNGAPPAPVPRIRRTARELSHVHARALEREGRFFIRWRFWIPPEEEERRFEARVDHALGGARGLVEELELLP